jgi:hypothetical protein
MTRLSGGRRGFEKVRRRIFCTATHEANENNVSTNHQQDINSFIAAKFVGSYPKGLSDFSPLSLPKLFLE